MKLEDYKQIESTNIDFKEKLETSHPKSWLKSVSAFANTKEEFYYMALMITEDL